MRISDWSSDVCSSDLTVDRWAQRQRYEEAVDEQPLLVHPREVSGIEIPREAGPVIAAGILLNPSADEVRPDRQAIVMQVAQHPIELRVPVIPIAHVSRLERSALELARQHYRPGKEHHHLIEIGSAHV